MRCPSEEEHLNRHLPGHILMVDHEHLAVVLAIRGTMAMQDVLADLVCEQMPFKATMKGSTTLTQTPKKAQEGEIQEQDTQNGQTQEEGRMQHYAGYAHRGMLRCARKLLARLREHIYNTLRQNPGYGLVITGHSLGAGVATLIAVLLGPSFELPLSANELSAATVTARLQVGDDEDKGKTEAEAEAEDEDEDGVQGRDMGLKEKCYKAEALSPAPTAATVSIPAPAPVPAPAHMAKRTPQTQSPQSQTYPRDRVKVNVRCYAYAPPCVLSQNLSTSPLCDHIVSVVNGSDMVPRFGLSTALQLRAALLRMITEDKLVTRIIQKSLVDANLNLDEGSATQNKEYASQIMTWIRSGEDEHGRAAHLVPGGSILWLPPPPNLPNSTLGVEPRQVMLSSMECFTELQVCNTMFSDHMPQAYAKALL